MTNNITTTTLTQLINFLLLSGVEIHYLDTYEGYDEEAQEYNDYFYSVSDPPGFARAEFTTYLTKYPKVLREMVWCVLRFSELFPNAQIMVTMFRADGQNPRNIHIGPLRGVLTPEEEALYKKRQNEWQTAHVRSGRQLRICPLFRVS